MSAKSLIKTNAKVPLKLLLSASLFCIGATAHAADNAQININYDLRLAGFKIGSVGLAARLSKKSYSISTRAFTTGTVDKLLTFTIEARSRGKISNQSINSTEYMTAYSNKKVKRTVVVKYPDNRRVSVEATPRFFPPKDGVPLYAKHLRDVADPIGGMLVPINRKLALNDPNQCNQSRVIFDGSTNYKLTLSKNSKGAKGELRYKDAIACTVTYTPIAGHSKSSLSKYDKANVWLVPFEKSGSYLPVRIRIPTELGQFHIVSNQIKIDGAQKKAN